MCLRQPFPPKHAVRLTLADEDCKLGPAESGSAPVACKRQGGAKKTAGAGAGKPTADAAA